MSRRLAFVVVTVAIVVAEAGSVAAQGYGVYEQSACVMGRAGTAVASPCADGSAVYFNPAGIVLTPGETLSVGATVIAPRGHFTDASSGLVTDLNSRYYPVPNIYYKRNFAGDRASAGIGLFAPYGLTTDWPPDTAEGRFLGYKSLVHAIYVQPTIAFKLGEMVAVGGGVDITRTTLELRQRLDLASVPIAGTHYTFGTLPVAPVPAGTDFADVDLKGNAWHAGYHLGVIVRPNKRVSLGARYLSGQTVNVTNGTVTDTQMPTGETLAIPLGPTVPAGTPIDRLVQPSFAPGGKLSNQTATTSIPLPAQLVAGVALQPTAKLTALVDYQYVRWSSFGVLAVNESVAGTQTTIEDYANTSGVRLGIDYALSPLTVVRAGADFHGAAAPPQTVTPNLPEGSRAEFSAGVGRRIGRLQLDAYYMYLHQGDRAGRTVGPSPGDMPTVALNNGTYSFMSNLFGVTLSVHLGK